MNLRTLTPRIFGFLCLLFLVNFEAKAAVTCGPVSRAINVPYTGTYIGADATNTCITGPSASTPGDYVLLKRCTLGSCYQDRQGGYQEASWIIRGFVEGVQIHPATGRAVERYLAITCSTGYCSSKTPRPSSISTDTLEFVCEGTCTFTAGYRHRYGTDVWHTITCNMVSISLPSPSATISSCVFSGGAFFQAGDNDSSLSNLILSTGALTPVFASGTTSYTQTTTSSSLTVIPTASVTGATITVNGTSVASGAVSSGISLSIGASTITTIVTALDGSTSTYTVSVTRQLAAGSISLGDVQKYIDDPPFVIGNPTSPSAGAFSYASSNVSVATISGNTVTVQGLGTSTITVTQASDGTYGVLTATAILTVSNNPNDPDIAFQAIKSEVVSVVNQSHASRLIDNVKTADSLMAEKIIFHGEMLRSQDAKNTKPNVSFFVNTEGNDKSLSADGLFARTEVLSENAMSRTIINAKIIRSKNSSKAEILSAYFVKDWDIFSNISKQYRISLKQSNAASAYPITNRDRVREASIGASASRNITKNVFVGVSADVIYGQYKTKISNQYTTVTAKSMTYTLAMSGRINGQYELRENLFFKPSFALNSGWEKLIKKSLVSKTSLGSSAVEATLSLPSLVRIVIEPGLLYEGRPNAFGTQEFFSMSPNHICEELKIISISQSCNTGFNFHFGRKNDLKRFVGKIYFKYENLNSGPLHETGFQFKKAL